MSININSKKKWHPSRYENKEQIRKIQELEYSILYYTEEERIKILQQEDEENLEYI